MTTPNPALYVHNLNDKVNKEEICLQIYSLFSTYGSVIDLVASKGRKMKGQAFVVFADLASATAAMRSCEGMSFYGKPMRIEYAKTKSYATLKREDPDFVPPSVLKAQSNPPIALLNKNRMNGSGDSMKRSRDEDGEEGSRPRKRPNGTQEEDDQEMEIDEDEDEGNQTNPATAPPTNATSDKSSSSVLTCTNLPQEVTDDVLAVLFQQYRGFQSTRVAASPNPPAKMATVYFESPELASVAKTALDGFLLKKGWSMSVV